MVRGNKEIRFRAEKELHDIVEATQKEIGAIEKTAAAKLLIELGNDKINDAVKFFDSITHPLKNQQFEEFFLSLKIRVKQLRNERDNIKKLAKRT